MIFDKINNCLFSFNISTFITRRKHPSVDRDSKFNYVQGLRSKSLLQELLNDEFIAISQEINVRNIGQYITLFLQTPPRVCLCVCLSICKWKNLRIKSNVVLRAGAMFHVSVHLTTPTINSLWYAYPFWTSTYFKLEKYLFLHTWSVTPLPWQLTATSNYEALWMSQKHSCFIFGRSQVWFFVRKAGYCDWGFSCLSSNLPENGVTVS
jgi:hypothetical protein